VPDDLEAPSRRSAGTSANQALTSNRLAMIVDPVPSAWIPFIQVRGTTRAGAANAPLVTYLSRSATRRCPPFARPCTPPPADRAIAASAMAPMGSTSPSPSRIRIDPGSGPITHAAR
jgi:hypothetical protein